MVAVKRILRSALVISALASFAAACSKSSSPAPAAQPGPSTPGAAGATAATAPAPPKPLPPQLPAVLARVNGENVERWELENAAHGVESRAGGPMPADRRDEIMRGLLDQLVAYHALSQEAHARHLDPSDGDVDAQMNVIKGGFPNEQAFQQALSGQGITVDQLRRQTRMSLQVAKVIDSEVTSKIAVTDADAGAFYKQNVERFKQGETVHASHILVAVPQGAGDAQKQQARAKAQQIVKALRGGADFATLARERSEDPGSARNGGDLGFFQKGQMDPSFETVAFGLKPGATSGIVETPFGFHIIRAQERRPPRTAPLAEVNGQIKEFLTGQQREQKLAAFVDQAKAKSKIEMLV
jgi:peptidyl-prolyl cis-trans isomerase C